MALKKDIGNLSIEIEEGNDLTVFRFSGDVNEHFRFQEFPEISSNQVVFDLEHIQSFNSCGIREWINLISQITPKTRLKFEKCSIVTIDQINMVPDVAKNVEIVSFFAPYFCESDEEVSRLIVSSEQIDSLNKKTAPDLKCDICQDDLEFDAIEESYFLFLDIEGALPKAS